MDSHEIWHAFRAWSAILFKIDRIKMWQSCPKFFHGQGLICYRLWSLTLNRSWQELMPSGRAHWVIQGLPNFMQRIDIILKPIKNVWIVQKIRRQMYRKDHCVKQIFQGHIQTQHIAKLVTTTYHFHFNDRTFFLPAM